MHASTGILLINLGTPSAPDLVKVKQYLKEFLTDPKVIDLPNPWRYLLVNALIIPRRAKNSAHAYQQIWTENGSPLMVHSLALKENLQQLLGPDYQVSLGMNYGEPQIAQALDELKNCERIIVVPLFPQYSSAVTQSIINKVQSLTSKPLNIIKDFYNENSFITAMAAQIQSRLDDFKPEYLLFSYHGLPMRQLYKTSGKICESCTLAPCPTINTQNRDCYRAQCFETSRLITQQLSLNNCKTITSFQSRLGRLTWTSPYTENTLQNLASNGIKRIAVTCPSFVTDCLETLEEIGIRARDSWKTYGGDELILIPALNSNAQYLFELTQKWR